MMQNRDVPCTVGDIFSVPSIFEESSCIFCMPGPATAKNKNIIYFTTMGNSAGEFLSFQRNPFVLSCRANLSP